MDDCKKKLKKFIVYVNENNKQLRKDYKEFRREEVQTHFKDLIKAWNIKNKKSSFLWDIKIHHSYIGSAFINNKGLFDIPYWSDYVLATQRLRLNMGSYRS